jgi:hypothetical protein
MRRATLTVLALAVVLTAITTSSASAADWRAWPMPIPSGGKYETPVGVPGDLSFYGADRGLLTVGGNNAVPEGIFSWDGTSWHQLATVCGSGASARVAWAGPDEFWAIARPSLPRVQSEGTALCHIKDGAVVGSYSTPPGAEDPYAPMEAAACNGPNDCWFGGVYAVDGIGRRNGAFHLHWDGSALRTVYGPQGRAVSDLLFDHGGWLESTFLAPTPLGAAADVILSDPEPVPRLLHTIAQTMFAADPFTVADAPAGTQLRALDGDETTTWAVGGGTAQDGNVSEREPLVVRRDGGGAWAELPPTATGDALAPDMTFADVAAVPGTGTAWAALVPTGSFSGAGEATEVVHIAADGTRSLQILSGADTGVPARGAAERIACPAADDCWLVTADGFLFRLADAPAYAANGDPAFQGTITVRPNEAAEQAIPDDLPEDDSGLPAPTVQLPDADDTEITAGAGVCALPKVLLSNITSKVHGRRKPKLVVSFRMARTAKVAVVARRGGKVVARSKLTALKPGRRSLTLALSRRRWPTKLSFTIRGEVQSSKRCVATASRVRPPR